MNRRLFICLAFYLLVNCVHSDSSPEPLTNYSEPWSHDSVPSPSDIISPIDTFSVSPFYSSDLKLVLDKDQYVPGDTLHANITLQDMENFPITDTYLIVEIVEGKEHLYPADRSDDNNVFYEAVVGSINLASGSSKTVPFSYNLPQDLRNGNYLFEVYAETKRTPLVGMPFIFLSPQNTLFRVSGAGNFPSAKILWNETLIDGESGQVGPGVNASSVFSGRVYVQNRQNSKANYLLNVTICQWDDIVCGPDEYVSGKQYPVSLDPGKVSAVDIELKAPDKPDAYAIRLELSENGRTLSIYRSRIVVLGPTAKIRKMTLDKLYLQKGDSGKIMLLVGASPDHYTFPEIVNAKATVSISVDGKEVYADSTLIPSLSAANDTTGLVPEIFEFTSPEELKTYMLCSKIESEKGEVYDRYCFTVDPSKIIPTETTINVSWDYDYTDKVLNIGLCTKDASGLAANSRVTVMLLNPSGSIEAVKEGIMLPPCSNVTINADAGEHTLVVNDLNTNKQTEIDINIIKKSETPHEQAPVCGNNLCEPDEETHGSCCTDCGCAQNAECINNACEAKETTTEPTQPQIQQKKDSSLSYLGSALIALGILLFILRNKSKAK
jgi:hypothetical protein